MVDNVIRLFESDALDYSSIGLGYMDDCLSCTVTEERNGSFELEMEYPISGKRFNDLVLNRIIVAHSNPYLDYPPQAFRIYSISKPMNGSVRINAQHISYDLNGVIVKHLLQIGSSVSEIWRSIKTASNGVFPNIRESNWDLIIDPECSLIYEGDYSVDKPTPLRGILGGREGSIIQVFEKGEWEFNNHTIVWHSTYSSGGVSNPGRGRNRGVTIRYGKNLQDLKQDESSAETYDAVYPYWFSTVTDSGNNTTEELVTLEEPIAKSPEIAISKVLDLDLTDKFESKPSPEQLRSKARSYISDHNLWDESISLQVTMAVLNEHPEFENVRLCDQVHIFYERYNIDVYKKVIKTVYDCKKGRYQGLELGDNIKDLSDSLMEKSSTTVINNITSGASVVQDGASNVLSIS